MVTRRIQLVSLGFEVWQKPCNRRLLEMTYIFLLYFLQTLTLLDLQKVCEEQDLV